MSEIVTIPNPDLVVLADNKPGWNQLDRRRHGFHNFHRLARYSQSFRAARVMVLEKRMDLRIPALESVRALTTLPWFSALAVVRGRHVLFERYAPDFGPDRPHGIQSISKMIMNLVIGRLVEEGKIDPGRRVAEYLPEIGSGYATATVQQLLNMDVANDYTEDYDDPFTSAYLQEEAVGWRLPRDAAREDSTRAFVARIAFFSVLEDKNAYDLAYFPPVIRMLAEIARLDFAGDPA